MTSQRLQRIEEVYHSAREREPGERETFLAEACRGDSELHREVESMLSQDEREGILERPAMEVAADLLADPAPEQPSVGAQLGPYRIESRLGAGGMGEVYRARDTRLNRTVAIKILKHQFSNRFEREARAIAALNHPNICTLHDVGPNYLVMELVEGPTLAERIGEGAIGLQESLGIAGQIADALAAAHEKGIIHCDLKPANIKITSTGTVKLLDFGLARLAAPPAFESNPENSKLAKEQLTRSGMVLGTAGYMSPEQVRGDAADKRVDIWAFGVVLYEMLTGRRLFQGESPSDTIAAVLTKEPAWDDVPLITQRLLRRCLEKDPRRRLRDIGDAMPLLEDLPEIRPARRSWPAWSAVALATVLAAFFAILYFRETPTEARSVRFEIAMPDNADEFHLSPDGRYLALRTVGDHGGISIRRLDSLQTQFLAGTEGAYEPFWSPDSASLAFFAEGKLKKVAVGGGPPQTICDVAGAYPIGAAWNRAGTILFSTSAGGVFRVPADGGVPSRITKLAEGFHAILGFLPDGRHFLEAVVSRSGISGVYGDSLDGTAPVRILDYWTPAGFVPSAGRDKSGYLLFQQENMLMAQPFDPVGLRLTGAKSPVAERVGDEAFSASQNGVLAYGSGESGQSQELVWMDRSGKRVGWAGPAGVYRNFRLAPDEKRVVIERGPVAVSNLWVLDLTRGVTSALTFGPGLHNFPIWSPDGQRVLFGSIRNGRLDLYIKAASGAGQEELLVKMATRTGWGSDWSRDGRFILYEGGGGETHEDLWIAPQFGDRKQFPYLNTQFNEQEGAFSPDGRWIAYMSDESGRDEIYVQAFPLSGAKFQISTGGGSEPIWRRDGGELFYVGAARNLMAVPVKTGPKFEVGAPKSLIKLPGSAEQQMSVRSSRHSYAVSGDGQRFLVPVPVAASPAAPPITVWLNWNADLKN
jgi:eukaryotic-like serine/threonine-protein kinase